MRGRRHRGEARPAVPSWLLRRGDHVPDPRSPERDSARIAALASEVGAPIDEVLREVADFRLALETDMIIAAAAADEDELGLVADMLDGERVELAAFQRRMLVHLGVATAQPTTDELAVRRSARGERLAGRARLVATAAALVALVGGGMTVTATSPRESSPSTEQVALALADEQLSTLTGQIIRSASSADITDAASDLHATLDALIAEHAEGDPAVAELIAELIREEQRMLVVDTSPATAHVLKDVARLVRKLQRVAPPTVVITPAPVASPKPSPSPTAKPTAKPSASAKPSPSASPTAKPSSSASASGTSSDGEGGNPIPTAAP